MKMVFLGTGGSGGPPGRAHNCILIETKDTRILLDAGEDCSWRLEEYGLTLCDLDTVYVSHLHVDHYIGLFDASVRALAHGCRRLTLAIAEPLVQHIDTVLGILPASIRGNARLLLLHGDNENTLGDIVLKPIKSCHAVECFGLVVSQHGVKVVYTADTSEPCPNILRYSRDATIIVHEAALPSGLEELAKEKGHTTVSQLIKLAKQQRSSLVASVHLSIESLRELQYSRDLPNNVIVPGDHTIIAL